MTEAQIKAKLRRDLQTRGFHVQAMSGFATNGTPDQWLSGPGGDLWLESKVDMKTKGAVLPKLRPLQKLWLNTQYKLGRRVAVFVATSTDEGVLYFDGDWNSKKNTRLSWIQILDSISAVLK